MHDGSTLWVLPIHTTFSDVDCISRLHQRQTVLNWKFHVLFRLSLNFVQLLIMSSRPYVYYFFFFFTCSREIIDNFLFWKKKSFFCTIVKRRSFKLCLYPCIGSVFSLRFDDLDVVSKSQVCQKYKLQIVLCWFFFRFLFSVV